MCYKATSGIDIREQETSKLTLIYKNNVPVTLLLSDLILGYRRRR